MAKKPVSVSFDTPDDAPRIIQAASLSLAILAYTKTPTFEGLRSAREAGDEAAVAKMAEIVLSDSDKDLLSDPDIAEVMLLVKAKVNIKDKRDQQRTIAACPVCGEWVLAGSTAAGRCFLTQGCPGSMVKASKAKRHKDA